MIKKIMLLLNSIILCVIISTSVVNASTVAEKSVDNITVDDFDNMTNDELNMYIDNIKKTTELQDTNGISSICEYEDVYNGTQKAWLAAAQVARNWGYPCAATLIEYSVKNVAYYESAWWNGNRGLLYDKIKLSSAFNNYIYLYRHTWFPPNSIVFEKSDNADLFYALHNVAISVDNLQGKITDTFDFAYDNQYNSLFTTCLNNWGWLSQQAGVLHKIPVKITYKF